jgi:hypothetical protein
MDVTVEHLGYAIRHQDPHSFLVSDQPAENVGLMRA